MADPAKETPSDSYTGALARYRETAKWVLTALGAAAVATIAGFGLADLGKLDPEEQPLRLIVAGVGLLAAVTGFFTCVYQAFRLASESWTEPRDLFVDQATLVEIRAKQPSQRTALEEAQLTINDPANAALGGFGSFEELSNAQTRALEVWKRQQARVAQIGDDSSKQLASRWYGYVITLSDIVKTATLVASTRLLRAKFDEAARELIGWGFVAALGIVAFAWAVTAPKPDTVEIIGPTPTEATLEVADGAQNSLQAKLGDKCDLDEVTVLVTAESDDKTTVIVTDSQCETIELEVTDTIGTVTES